MQPTWDLIVVGAGILGTSHAYFIDEVIHLVTGIRGKGMTTGPAVARETIDALIP